MLTSKQRAALRKLANNIDPIFQVGKGGVGEQMCKSISDALEARELIKLSVLDNCDYSAGEAAGEIASKVGADVVAVIGRRFVLYRESENNKSIIL